MLGSVSPECFPPKALILLGLGLLLLVFGILDLKYPRDRKATLPPYHPSYRAIFAGAFCAVMGLIVLAWAIGKCLGQR
jgi:hypothetical protein